MESSLQSDTILTVSFGILLPRDGSKCIIPTCRSQCPQARGHQGGDAARTSEADRQITAGTYENVAFKYTVVRDGATETLTHTIPRLVVTA